MPLGKFKNATKLFVTTKTTRPKFEGLATKFLMKNLNLMQQISGSAKVRNKWITPEMYKVLNANKKPYLNFLEGTPMRPTSKVV